MGPASQRPWVQSTTTRRSRTPASPRADSRPRTGPPPALEAPAAQRGRGPRGPRTRRWAGDPDPALSPQYGIKKKEEREAEAQAAMEANSEGSLTRPKKAIPPGCGDEPEEEDESILDTVLKYLPGPLQDMLKK